MELSNNQNLKESIIFPQRLFNLAEWTVLIPFWLALMGYVFTQNYIIVAVFFVLGLFFISLIYYFTYTKLSVNDSGIQIIRRFHPKIIHWEDIISMSVASCNGEATSYEIKTKNGLAVIPIPNNFTDFENLVMKNAYLEVYQDLSTPILSTLTGGPQLRQWKKIGENYQFTSLTDRLYVFSSGNNLTLKGLKRILIILLITFLLYFALRFFLVSRGYPAELNY
jgi:hypothetical protein